MKCWICGDIATTGEHKIMKSILKDVFKDSFENKNLLHIKDDKTTNLQGASSKKIQYLKSLCNKCNNQYTQPFDFSFLKFFEYIKNNHRLLFKTKMIDFETIYGESYREEMINLFKYFIKILGCDLNDNNLIIPKDLIEVIKGISHKTKLTLTFSIKDDYSILKNPIKNAIYGVGSLETSIENEKYKNEQNTFYKFSIELGYLTINYFYNTTYDIGLGSPWSANHKYIYLGTEYDSFEKIHKISNFNYTNIDSLIDNLVLNLRKLNTEKDNLINETFLKIKEDDRPEFLEKSRKLVEEMNEITASEPI